MKRSKRFSDAIGDEGPLHPSRNRLTRRHLRLHLGTVSSPPAHELAKTRTRRQLSPATSPESACASSPPRSPPKSTPSRRSRPIARATRRTLYFPPGQHPDRATPTPRRRSTSRAGAPGRKGSSWSKARASGPSRRARRSRPTTRSMRDEILDQLRAAMPVDGVLLGLHGAMIAHGYDDCEGDLIERVRAIVGPKVPIGVELDPHCHLTEKRVRRRRHHHPLQGIPAHRFRRARRGTGDADRQDHPRRDQTGHVALRLPA